MDFLEPDVLVESQGVFIPLCDQTDYAGISKGLERVAETSSDVGTGQLPFDCYVHLAAVAHVTVEATYRCDILIFVQ